MSNHEIIYSAGKQKIRFLDMIFLNKNLIHNFFLHDNDSLKQSH